MSHRCCPHAGKLFELSAVPPEEAPVFSLSPDRIVLGPKEAITTVITGLAAKPGEVCRGGVAMKVWVAPPATPS